SALGRGRARGHYIIDEQDSFAFYQTRPPHLECIFHAQFAGFLIHGHSVQPRMAGAYERSLVEPHAALLCKEACDDRRLVKPALTESMAGKRNGNDEVDLALKMVSKRE